LLDRTSLGVSVTDAEGASVRQISEKEINGETAIELSPPGGKVFKLQLRKFDALPAVYKTHSGEGELRAYSLRGGLWATESAAVGENFVAHSEGKRAFALKKTEEGCFRVRSFSNLLEYAGKGGGTEILQKGEHADFTLKELTQTTFSQDETSWRFGTQAPAQGLLQTPIKDEEDEAFRRNVIVSLAGMAALFLIALLIPSQDNYNPQGTRFVFAKKTGSQAAVAQGPRNSDEIPAKGSSQAVNPADMGPKAPVGPARPAEQPKSKKVAKAKAAPKVDHKAMAQALHKIEKSVAKAKAAPTRKAKPVRHAIAKAKTEHSVAHQAKRSKEKETNLESTAIARLLHDKSLRSASRGLEKGGVGAIQGERAQMAGIAAGETDLDETAGVARGAGVSARAAQVSGLGGGSSSPAGSEYGYGKGSHAAVAGQGNSFVNLDPSGSDVAEGLTKDQVGAVIYRHMSEIRYCYEAAMLRTPDVEGKLAVKFVIGGAGAVKTANVAQSSLGDSKLDDCVMKRLTRWQFPHPRGGVDVAVNYPFVFKTLGR
jgi:TonB family protein